MSNSTPLSPINNPPSSKNEVLTSKIEEHSSSSFLINTTTHKTVKNSDISPAEKKPPSSFHFTAFLKTLFSSNEKHLIEMQLNRVDEKYHPTLSIIVIVSIVVVTIQNQAIKMA